MLKIGPIFGPVAQEKRVARLEAALEACSVVRVFVIVYNNNSNNNRNSNSSSNNSNSDSSSNIVIVIVIVIVKAEVVVIVIMTVRVLVRGIVIERVMGVVIVALSAKVQVITWEKQCCCRTLRLWIFTSVSFELWVGASFYSIAKRFSGLPLLPGLNFRKRRVLFVS